MKSTLPLLYPTVYPTENLVHDTTKKSDKKEPCRILEIVRRNTDDRPVTTIYRGYRRVVVGEQVKRQPLRLTVARAWSELQTDSTVSTMTQYLQTSDEKTHVSVVDSTYGGQKMYTDKHHRNSSDIDLQNQDNLDDSLSVYSLDSTYSGVSSDDEIIHTLKKKTPSAEIDLTSNILQYKNCTLTFSPCHRDDDSREDNSEDSREDSQDDDTKKDIHYDSSEDSEDSPDIFAMDDPVEQADLYDESSNDINLDLQFARLAVYMDGCC